MEFSVTPAEMKHIKEWISTVDYLPQNFDDLVIQKFIHCSYKDLEATKKCIEKFCTKRGDIPEVFTNRDPLSEKLQAAYAISRMAYYEAEEMEILIHQLHIPDRELFNSIDVLKVMSMNSDYWIKLNPFIPESHILIIDAKEFTFSLMQKFNLLVYRAYLLFILESLPVRLKHVHIINLRMFSEKIFGFIKAVLPSKLCKMISFHPNVESLQKAVGKQYLPLEYGGDAPSLIEKHENWLKEIKEQREMFLDDNLWKAKKNRSSTSNPSKNYPLAFNTLSID